MHTILSSPIPALLAEEGKSPLTSLAEGGDPLCSPHSSQPSPQEEHAVRSNSNLVCSDSGTLSFPSALGTTSANSLKQTLKAMLIFTNESKVPPLFSKALIPAQQRRQLGATKWQGLRCELHEPSNSFRQNTYQSSREI